ncbi:MAG: hypothetical protein SGILL_003998, partial [Bacillariaceae sp.]
MKLSAAIVIASVGSSAAFAPQSKPSSVMTTLSMSEEQPVAVVEESVVTEAAALPDMSQSLPFMERPSALDGSLAGDVGFDPLGFAKDTSALMNYREAEIKHA